MSENASFPETELMDKTAVKSYIDEILKQDYPHGRPDPYYKLYGQSNVFIDSCHGIMTCGELDGLFPKLRTSAYL
jgi:hypothetical protein